MKRSWTLGRANGLVTVEDLGSTNGTRLRPPNAGRHDGVRVLGSTPIRVGDIIQIGRTNITWTMPVGENVQVTP